MMLDDDIRTLSARPVISPKYNNLLFVLLWIQRSCLDDVNYANYKTPPVLESVLKNGKQKNYVSNANSQLGSSRCDLCLKKK